MTIDAEQKTYENEVDKSSVKEETKNPNHGGKREGAGRPFGSKSKPSKWKSMEEMSIKYQNSPLDYLLAVLNTQCLPLIVKCMLLRRQLLTFIQD